MKVVLYTTHCPRCEVLASKLSSAAISYEVVEDTEVMLSKGIMSAPMLEVDGSMLEFKQAVDWVNKGGAILS